jgi:hypothetical protein
LVGHAAGTNLGTGGFDPAPASAGDANGSAAAATPQIAMNMNGILRTTAPRAWMPEPQALICS